jgi:hypothetical protein
VLIENPPELTETPYQDEFPIDICEYIDTTPGLSWWEKECFKRKIIEKKTFKELEDEYNIPAYSIQYSYNKVIKKIRKRYDKEYPDK